MRKETRLNPSRALPLQVELHPKRVTDGAQLHMTDRRPFDFVAGGELQLQVSDEANKVSEKKHLERPESSIYDVWFRWRSQGNRSECNGVTAACRYLSREQDP